MSNFEACLEDVLEAIAKTLTYERCAGFNRQDFPQLYISV